MNGTNVSLLHQAVRFGQCDATTIQQRQHVAIEVTYGATRDVRFGPIADIRRYRLSYERRVSTHSQLNRVGPKSNCLVRRCGPTLTVN
jgi:hypothetical protein